jgi:ankyrin repeat protein
VIPLKGEKKFAEYLKGEVENWIHQASYEEARRAILDGGQPFTQEALIHCVGGGITETVTLFLKAGFSPDTSDTAGVPLLCHAARGGRRETVKLLLDAGADVNRHSGDRGGSALIDSALGKHLEIAGDLLAAGAETNIKSKDGQSALIISVGLNDIPMVDKLLAAGADPDAPDALGASARKYASLFKKPEILELFEKYAK